MLPPLKLQPLPIRWLTPVIPPTLLLLLITAKTRAQLDVDAWRVWESEALGHLDEIEFVHVENGAQGVRGVGLEIRAVAIFCGLLVVFVSMGYFMMRGSDSRREAYLVQIIVLSNELLQLGLDIDNLGSREIELDYGNTRLFEVFQETDLRWLQEHQTAALAFFASCSTADSVDIVSCVIGRVELDDPINSGDLLLSVDYRGGDCSGERVDLG